MFTSYYEIFLLAVTSIKNAYLCEKKKIEEKFQLTCENIFSDLNYF